MLVSLSSLDYASAQATTPFVTQVAIVSDPGPDDTYARGQVITVSMTFSEAVTVTGTPKIYLEFDGALRAADYSGAGAGTGQLLFNYTVQPDDRDDDGVSVAAYTLTLNGGSIRSQDDSTDAILGHTGVHEPGHRVNGASVIFSNIEQAAASDAITVTADSSASLSFRAPVYTYHAEQNGRLGRFVQRIALDIVQPSDTLDLTIRIANADNTNETYTFTGSAATTGRQVFVHQPAGGTDGPVALIRPRRTYSLTISGSGTGSVQIGATTSGGVDATGAGSWLVTNPSQGSVPRVRFMAFDTATPYIHHAGVISSPPDGDDYRAGERIEVLFVIYGRIAGTAPVVAELWFGNGREHRREAAFVTQTKPASVVHGVNKLVYAYTVQSGDLDADGMMIGENPLGLNADGGLASFDSPRMSANLLLSATQLGTGQHVNGAEQSDCQAVLCGKLVADRRKLTDSPVSDTLRSGYSLVDHEQSFPYSYFGKSSRSTFRYSGVGYALAALFAGEYFVKSTDMRLGDYLDAQISPHVAENVLDRLAFVLDDAADTTYVFRDGRITDPLHPQYYSWSAPGLRWAQDEVHSFQIIELPVTVTFDAGSYAMQEGESFDVRVNLGTSFETKRVVLPLVVTAFGGATVDDYSGIPEQLEFEPGETEKTFTATLTQDDVDDDDEGLTLSFGAVPDAIKEGGDHEMATIVIRDDDDPPVDVSFEQGSYSVPEGDAQTVNVTLSADPERTVAIPITVTPQGGVTGADYDHTALPMSLTFNAGQTVRTITFITTQDGVDDDDESVRLAFGSPLPDRVSIGSHGETTLHIVDDDDPPVEISFEQGSYTVPEGDAQTVRVTLSADPEREVTVLITVTHQDGATGADYSGVPESLVFSPVETEKTFDFSATQDDGDDDDESVRLTFGNLPPRVSRGSVGETTLHIVDDDDPVVEISFEHAEYGVFEGGEVTLAVVLSADPERTVTVPLTRTNEGGATGSDYSGVPASVTFASGETRKTFVFEALEDTDEEDGESVKLGFGIRPDRVGLGANDETTVTIRDCEGGGIWCGTVDFDVHVERADGRKKLLRTYLNRTGTLDYDQFLYNGVKFEIAIISLKPAPGGAGNPRPPFHIPERGTLAFSLHNASATDPGDRYSMPNEDYLDWTLYIKTGATGGGTLEAALPFNEAKFCCGRHWRWYGLDLEELNAAWSEGKLYKLRIVEDPRADRVAEALGPPLHLEVEGANRRSMIMRWVRPQIRNDGAPPGVSYRIEWKMNTGSWGTAADVSEHVYEPRPGNEWLFYTIRGLTLGVWYNVRVIAVNDAGDSPPSNVATRRTDPDPNRAQQAESEPNNPATGAPGISGTPAVGGTLTADVSGISDGDGLSNAVFAYQWLADDAEIANATGATYTVVSADEGKAIRIRVDFTDDAGNGETLTSAATEAVTAAALRLDLATVDGAALTLTYNESLDEGVSIPAGAFTVRVEGNSRPVTNVSVSGSGVTLTLSPAAAGETVTVDYTRPDGPDFIRDTRGRVADSFSGRKVTNQTPIAETGDPFTASVHDAPTSHDGSTVFTFELRFSEEPKENFSYRTLLDHAFTVTRGEISGVRRLEPPGNTRWEIQVRPNSGRNVGIALPITTDCAAAEAICTGDGRMLSNRLEFNVAAPNTPATGQPSITGAPRVGETLTAATTGIEDADGLANAVFTYQWLAGGTDIEGAVAASYTLTADEEGLAIQVGVSFTDDAGNPEAVTSAATGPVAPASSNKAATGAPVINGTARVGETLTADTSGIADADGLENVTFTYLWLASGIDIEGAANAASYTLTSDQQGLNIQVWVTFTDDAGNPENLTSAATEAVAAARPPLTARFLGAPESHDGSAVFTFELRFSEEPKSDFSYTTLRDHAFTVTGGEISGVRRLKPPGNVRWEIQVTPDSDSAVTIVLPVTTDCTADGAICTGDGRMLSNRLEITVPGPGE